MARALKGQDIKIFGDGEQTRDFIHVRDIAMSNVVSAESSTVSGQINLGTGSAISTMVNEIVGSQGKILHESMRPGDVRHCTASTVQSKAKLKFDMNSNFFENLTKYCQWMKQDTVVKR